MRAGKCSRSRPRRGGGVRGRAWGGFSGGPLTGMCEGMNGLLTALASKEFRALLPVWAAAAFTIGADTGLRGTGMHSLFPLGLFAYIAGSLALGAHVIGHEFTNRTLASLLVQPCRRSSMLLAKASVLAVMLMALGFIARVVLFQSLARTLGNFPRYPP